MCPSDIAATIMFEREMCLIMLYSRSRCDWMVSKFNGNIMEALRELKLEYLMDTGIVGDKTRARRALEEKNWSLNAAAEALLS
uniref:UBA domain-containing protein n=1 Tax=Heterorhabditis bacteriophora TaxID=37862 RepID=A0A1I7XGQ7_HETBA